MEEQINSIIKEYYKNKNIPLKSYLSYNKITLKNTNIIDEIELLCTIIQKYNWDDKLDVNDYYYVITSTYSVIIGGDYSGKNKISIDFNNSHLSEKYYEDNLVINKCINLFYPIYNSTNNNLEIEIRKKNISRYNYDDKSLFQIFFNYSLEQKKLTDDEKNLIYIKKYDYPNNKKIIFQDEKLNSFFNEKNTDAYNIFDEIYNTKLFSGFEKNIIRLEKIMNKKLFFCDDKKYSLIQLEICVEKYSNEISEFIKNIKNYFDQKIIIILYINELSNDSLTLYKKGLINCIYIKNIITDSSIWLKDNKIVIFYDLLSSNKELIPLINEIKSNNLIDEIIFLFNKNYHMHKIILSPKKICYLIKDKAMSNYCDMQDFDNKNENYSNYLLCENNSFFFDIFNKINPDISEAIFQINFSNQNLSNEKAILQIKGCDLFKEMINLHQSKNYFFDKIYFETENDDFSKIEKEIFEIKSIEFPSRNIYIVPKINDDTNDYTKLIVDSKKNYVKRGYKTLLPFLSLVYKEKRLKKKPVMYEIAKFISYKVDLYIMKIYEDS